ncbi:hypothetical protein [Halomonas ramblicola]|uniref:hypothetical protein n=1 Tax=Halomonas ramblicola TaxID=747349 RepID=UPI0025B42FE9|nr:hypothetical protein [Halomonas ramblicola]MDN3520886.1 hypothetical protein [Halomonas ramblicola]
MALRLARLGPGAFSGLWQRLGIAPIEVWVIKQIDTEVLHLCGIGTLHTEQRPWRALTDLKRGRYCGGVRLGQTGIVLNSRLFAALIPLDSLHLEGPAKARWQGRDWQVSRVPQRSWQYEGRLVAHPEPGGGQARLVSGEDVAGIRDNIDPDACPPGTATFQPGTHWGDPAISAWKARVRRHSKDDPH